VPVTEGSVRRVLMDAIHTKLPEAVALRFEDRYTKGIPDLALALNGKTSFWEIKYADPHCMTSRVQHYLCEQLDSHAFHCRYLIFQRGIPRAPNARPRQIRIVSPHDFKDWKYLGLVISEGKFDYDALIKHFKQVHR
jgi:hypothetical protein